MTVANWRKWKIPLTSVNLGKIEKMRIVIDDRTSPAKGGTGCIIDDIGLLKS